MNQKKETAIFSAGCFWHVEDVFSKIPGVIETEIGYTGGYAKNPTYEQVSSGKTGHAESIKITFNPKKISYEKLVDIFWKIHNPALINRQSADIGSNYRSAIFYLNKKQKETALKSKNKLQKKFARPIATEIKKAIEFYQAEKYHQKYFQKNQKIKCNI
ncbi:peptide-methionine (S)-S-oxide reductase MsrA [Candidatus Pacearchaeota archaeon]|nr:peptide-methionine (S)-S-oxide reductase MsrA [Candidatus Pacearchaeota archaeon]